MSIIITIIITIKIVTNFSHIDEALLWSFPSWNFCDSENDLLHFSTDTIQCRPKNGC